jgi:hypothetical protein
VRSSQFSSGVISSSGSGDERIGDEDLDPKLLLWDMHRNIDHAAVPDGRIVVQFRFPDAPADTRDWWLVITADDADVCDADPGYPVAVTVTASLRRMVEVWRGDLGWPNALPSRHPKPGGHVTLGHDFRDYLLSCAHGCLD